MLVIGVDVGLLHTALAVIEEGAVGRRCTINVEGDTEDVGPRFVKLREGLETVSKRVLKGIAPAVISIEQPELGIRKGHDAGSVLKLYGAFAVCYAECARLWPKAHVMGVLADTVRKPLRAGIMRAKYRVECPNSHVWDAIWQADLAWDIARARAREAERASENA